MMRFSLRQWLVRGYLDRKARGRRRFLAIRRPARPFDVHRFEGLEDRRLLTSITWSNPAGGKWDNPANWTGGAIPGSGDDAVISTASAATITIKSGDHESVHSLTTAANDPLSITGVQFGDSSLTVAANSTLDGSVSVSAGTLELKGGSIGGSGSVYVIHGGALNVTGPVTDTSTGTIYVGEAPGTGNPASGTLTVDQNLSAANLELDAGGTLNGTANLTVTGNLKWNAGTMSGTGATTIAPAGTLTIAASGILSQRTLNNAGDVEWNSGDLRLDGNAVINNTGAWHDNGDHNMRPLSQGPSGSLANAGSYTKTGGTQTSSIQVPLDNAGAGSMEIDSGTLELSPPVGIDDTSEGQFRLIGGDLSIVQGAVDFNAGTTVTGPATLDIPFSKGGTLNVNAHVPVAGSVSNGSNLVLAPGGLLSLGGGYTQPVEGTNLTVEISGSAASGQFGKLNASGAAALAKGLVNPVLEGGYVPGDGQSYQVMTFASQTGTMSVSPLASPSGLFTLVVNPTKVLLNTQGAVGAGPTANPDTFVLSQSATSGGSGATSVLANDTSADGQPQNLTATLVSTTTHGSLTLNADGSFSYTPVASFAGIDRFTYQVHEGAAAGNTVGVTLLSYHASLVDKLYQQVLHRSAEDGGLMYWTGLLNQGASLDVVATGIFDSVERLDPLVTNFYEKYLTRGTDPGGLTYWVADWQRNGGPDHVVVNILASKEFFDDGGDTNDGFVTLLYQRFLGRAPEPGGFGFWTGKLNSGQLTTGQVAADFQTTHEQHVNLVDFLYGEYFNGATPTSAQAQPYIANLDAGQTETQIEVEIIDSPDYANTPPAPAPGAVGRALYPH